MAEAEGSIPFVSTHSSVYGPRICGVRFRMSHRVASPRPVGVLGGPPGMIGVRMLVRTATIVDMPAVWSMYADVAGHMQATPPDIWWRMGMHPSRERLEQAMGAGELLIAVEEADEDAGCLVGALILDDHQVPDYKLAPWAVSCPPDEVRVVHLLCVHPQARGRGVGRLLLAAARDRARAAGARSLRLDTFDTNEPAIALYRSFGFIDHGVFDIEVGGGLQHASHLMELDLMRGDDAL